MKLQPDYELFNYMDIKRIVQEIVTEAAGVQMDVKKMSEALADLVISAIEERAANNSKILNGKYWDTSPEYDLEHGLATRTWINTIKVEIAFCNSTKVEPTGKFLAGKTKKHEGAEPSFSIGVALTIQAPIEDLKNERTGIRSVLAHELNHAFVFIRDVEGKAAVMNAKNNSAKGLHGGHDAGVQILSRAIYLTNPMEVQGRIQDIGGLVGDLKSDNAEDALTELLLYPPFKELSELNNMDLSKIDVTTAVEDFVREMGGSDVKAFIASLDKKRHDAAKESLRKAYRLVSDRYSVNENFWIEADAFRIIHDSDWPPREIM